MKTKVCIKCSGDKPIKMFYEHPKMKDGHLNKCITCCIANSKSNRMSQAAQKWRLEHREEQLEKQRPNRKKWKKDNHKKVVALNKAEQKRNGPIRRTTRQLLFDKVKSEQGCVDCGITNPIVLDFHHINPSDKEMAVSTMIMHNYAIHRIKAEVVKCIVVCSNCHRIRHHSNRWSNQNSMFSPTS